MGVKILRMATTFPTWYSNVKSSKRMCLLAALNLIVSFLKYCITTGKLRNKNTLIEEIGNLSGGYSLVFGYRWQLNSHYAVVERNIPSTLNLTIYF